VSLSPHNPQKVVLYKRTWTSRKTRSERRGAEEEPKAASSSWLVGGRCLDRIALLGHRANEHIYPFRSQMAKVELEGVFCELRLCGILESSSDVYGHKRSGLGQMY
jgi:hypothetical protein